MDCMKILESFRDEFEKRAILGIRQLPEDDEVQNQKTEGFHRVSSH
jgi:hypothetical protein